MSKYDNMIATNKKKSDTKIEQAKQAIYEMLEAEEKITIPKLMNKTGLSRGFFYKNPVVRKEVDRAMQRQAGLVDRRKKILDMAMEGRIITLEETIADLKRENAELRKQNEKYQKALNKKELNMLRGM
jgi:hypothetical protein